MKIQRIILPKWNKLLLHRHMCDGISYSPDKMLQGRILSYPDAHRHRLGANYEQIPVNRCPYAVNNYERDGCMRVDGNGGSNPNYFPNSFDNIKPDEAYKNVPPHRIGYKYSRLVR